jgi:glycosyltransferase involved in cell wall biosynthesis
MWLPLVSIILPAYNSEKYIAAAVTSITEQVYDNFELIIINDGSTDKTSTILSSLTDQRIMVLNNDGNNGLIFSLNRGIDESKGEFIARMDADDICTNDRIEKQVHWLLHHPEISAVGTFIKIIDENSVEKGDWSLDRNTSTKESIRKVMPKENCLAHPTAMIRSDVLKKYKYSAYQKNIEDYDLWLRMLADGLVIEKVPQPLLLYRDHTTSVTNVYLKKQNPFLKNYHCKRKFLAARIKQGKWGVFESRVLSWMLKDRLMALGKSIKQKIRK